MGGKKKQSAGTIVADTLYNQDNIELGLGMCEGTIVGLDKGLQSFYVNNIPIESESGEPNFQDICINIRQGYYDDQPIHYIMGGEASVINNSLGLTLPADVPRLVITPPQFRGKIKALDVRIAIQQLYAGDGKNVEESSIIFQVKYRRVGDTAAGAAGGGAAAGGAAAAGSFASYAVSAAVSLGIGLVITGLMQLLAPKPKLDKDGNYSSRTFGARTTTEVGTPIQMVFGVHRIGFHLFSFNVDSRRYDGVDDPENSAYFSGKVDENLPNVNLRKFYGFIQAGNRTVIKQVDNINNRTGEEY